ncbi:hypothetical protein IQ07DRAFT_603433 [Pyrenochaeta sp. DS3sAY3a]|nr:hypothetical protein IQ07DRAFT_603433 [Pyrenochaeta sp. DS3sAY3a]
MELTTLPLLLLWTLLTSLPLISALALPPTALDLTSSPPPGLTNPTSKRCTNNALQNPGFEAGIDPWLPMVSGSWATRGVYTAAGGGHSGANFYYGYSNSTIDTTLTIGQSGIKASGRVGCGAWVASRRPGNVGSTRVEVFLDGQSCGLAYLGTTGWTRVGGSVDAQGGELGSTIAVTVFSDEASEEGWSVWVDDVWVGSESC